VGQESGARPLVLDKQSRVHRDLEKTAQNQRLERGANDARRFVGPPWRTGIYQQLLVLWGVEIRC
jgi:hypothetical protein